MLGPFSRELAPFCLRLAAMNKDRNMTPSCGKVLASASWLAFLCSCWPAWPFLPLSISGLSLSLFLSPRPRPWSRTRGVCLTLGRTDLRSALSLIRAKLIAGEPEVTE